MSVTIEDPAGATAIRPFTIPKVPDAELEALRARIAATRWPDEETVTDYSQGVPLAMVQELAGYWATDYDWRRCEAKLDALPHFMTEIDGLDIHFIHIRSRHEDALPLIVTHGGPARSSSSSRSSTRSPIPPPTARRLGRVPPGDPVAAGLRVFRQAAAAGWDLPRIARAWVVLMKRLGYPHLRRKAATGAGRSRM